MSAIVSGVSSLINGIVGIFASVLEGIFGVFRAAFGVIEGTLSTAFSIISNVVKGAVDIVLSLLSSVAKLFGSSVNFLLGNLFGIVVLAGAYFAYTTYFANGKSRKRKTR